MTRLTTACTLLYPTGSSRLLCFATNIHLAHILSYIHNHSCPFRASYQYHQRAHRLLAPWKCPVCMRQYAFRLNLDPDAPCPHAPIRQSKMLSCSRICTSHPLAKVEQRLLFVLVPFLLPSCACACLLCWQCSCTVTRSTRTPSIVDRRIPTTIVPSKPCTRVPRTENCTSRLRRNRQRWECIGKSVVGFWLVQSHR